VAGSDLAPLPDGAIEGASGQVGATLTGGHEGTGLRIGIACARFNGGVTLRLLNGALDALAEAGTEIRRWIEDAPFPPELLAAAPKTSFGATIYELATREPTTFRAVAAQVSALPGGLDFVGTPEQLADLVTEWYLAEACDGFTLMPHILPDELTTFVREVAPILERRGLRTGEYAGRTLRDHFGLPRPVGTTSSAHSTP